MEPASPSRLESEAAPLTERERYEMALSLLREARGMPDEVREGILRRIYNIPREP